MEIRDHWRRVKLMREHNDFILEYGEFERMQRSGPVNSWMCRLRFREKCVLEIEFSVICL